MASAGVAHAGDDPDVGAGQCQVIKFCVGVGVGDETGGSGGQAGGSEGGSSDSDSKLKCGYTKIEPKPPAEHPAWKGQDPAKYDMYFMSCSDGGLNNPDGFIIVPEGQPPVPQVDPQELAQRAVDSMTLLGPDIGITPKPGGKGVVGMPVYMWTAKGPETYGPNTASASAGGITVTATAKVKKIVWKMGDGQAVTCTTAGTPYKAAYGKQPSPDCGYRYTQPSSTTSTGKYHVTATSTWVIDWQGGGQTGQLTEVRNSAVDITVAEVQVLN